MPIEQIIFNATKSRFNTPKSKNFLWLVTDAKSINKRVVNAKAPFKLGNTKLNFIMNPNSGTSAVGIVTKSGDRAVFRINENKDTVNSFSKLSNPKQFVEKAKKILDFAIRHMKDAKMKFYVESLSKESKYSAKDLKVVKHLFDI